MARTDNTLKTSGQYIRSQGYTYYAFISYKREDYKWAVWLKKKLQSYRLPARTARQYRHLPPRLSPVFLDKDSMKPGELGNQERDEVQSAKYLIVICSKKACQNSRNIDDEIQFFLDGGADSSRIIPFIIDDSPNPVQECFPRRLQEICRETNIIGANVNDSGRNNAVLKVIAHMHGLKLEELESEERRRRKKRAVFGSAAAAVLLAAVGATGYCHLDYYLPKYEYYLDYTESFGIPVGIGELKKEERQSLHSFYRLTRKEGKVRELRSVDQYGHITGVIGMAGQGRPVCIGYSYSTEGVLETVVYYDNNQKPLERREYSANLKTLDIKKYTDEKSSDYDASMLLGEHTIRFLSSEDDKRKSNVSRYLIDYDENGFVKEIRYASDSSNSIGVDVDGISGIRYIRDYLGRVMIESYLTYVGDNENDTADDPEYFELIGTENGLCSTEYDYDGFDCVEMRLVDAAGQPVTGVRKYSTERCGYSGHNCKSIDYCGIDGNPVCAIEGYAYLQIEYDKKGNVDTVRLLGTDQKPVECADGYSIQKYEYDDDGNLTCLRNLNAKERPVANSEKKAIIRSVYDDHGNIIKECYYDASEHPVMSSDNYASFTAEYDDSGNTIKKNFFDTYGDPVLNVYGYASMEIEYGEAGEIRRIDFFGTNGKPVLCKKGYASATYGFDNLRNPTRISYFDADNHPINPDNDYYCTQKTKYDKLGNIREVGYYDANDRLVCRKAGYAMIQTEYDNRGNMTKVKYLGAQKQPVTCESHYSTWISVFDGRGNRIRSEFRDVNDDLTISDLGFAAMETEYNAQGNKTKISYYGENNHLMIVDDLGYACVKMTYDNHGKMLSSSYFGTEEDQLIDANDGYARVEFTMDRYGNTVGMRYLNANNQLVIPPGESYAAIDQQFDERGNLLSEIYYGANGQPLMTEQGYASKKMEYNASNRVIRTDFYNEKGDPTVSNLGCASYIMEYDEAGNVIRESYLGANGKPISLPEGHASWTAEYNQFGRTKVAYFGVNGEPVMYKNYFWYEEFIYNESGKIIKLCQYDVNAALIIYMTIDYDDEGKVISKKYYDGNGNKIG